MTLEELLGKTDREIGQLLGVTHTTVQRYKEKGILEIKAEAILSGMAELPKVTKKQMGVSDELFDDLERRYGKGIIQTSTRFDSTEKVPIGVKELDELLGGGIARGRVINVYGEFAVGKTTLALMATREFQKLGKVLYLDTEHSLDFDYAKKLGVDVENLTYSHPVYGEDALEIMERVATDGRYSLVVLDSIAAMAYKPEVGDLIEPEKGKPQERKVANANIGFRARLMSSHFRVIPYFLRKNNCTALYLNQLRNKIATFGASGKIQPANNALEHASSQMIFLKKPYLKKGGFSHFLTEFKIMKDKVGGNPHKIKRFEIAKDRGFVGSDNNEEEGDEE